MFPTDFITDWLSPPRRQMNKPENCLRWFVMAEY